MTTMRERKENRIARLEEWADKRQAKANAIFKADDKLRSDLAFVAGQPGIGRSTIFKRTNAREAKEFEHRNMAQSMDRRAAGISDQLDRTIFDDDPDAIERLKERIATLEAKQERYKVENAAYRATHKPELKDMTVWQKDQVIPHPSYSVSNLGADVRRNTERLAKLERAEVHGEAPRYLYSVKRATTCRDCHAPIEVGKPARWYRQAQELACYPACS